MNLLNRILIILLVLIMMVVIPVTLIVPEYARYALQYAADIVQANIDWLYSLPPTAYVAVRAVLGGVGVVVFVICLLFLALEVIRIRRKTVRLKDGSGELLMEGIPGHLSYHVDLLADVLRVKPEVVSKGKSVQVSMYVETAREVNIPEKAAEIQETVRQVVEEQLGLRLSGDVKVTIKPVPSPQGLRGTSRSARPTRGRVAPVSREREEPLGEADLEDFDETQGKDVIEVKGPLG